MARHPLAGHFLAHKFQPQLTLLCKRPFCLSAAPFVKHAQGTYRYPAARRLRHHPATNAALMAMFTPQLIAAITIIIENP